MIRNAAIVVFSRLDSRRLPGKALLDLGGAPMLARVLDRTSRAGLPVIVATSHRTMDDPIAEFAGKRDLPCYRGDAFDVAGRALACAKAHGLDMLVRVSGDSPFIDPLTIGDVVQLYDVERPDLATNLSPRTFPAGMSVEAISVSALERMVGLTEEAADREHVTRFMYANVGHFRISNHACPDGDASACHLTVDTPADLVKARWLVMQNVTSETPRERVIALANAYERDTAMDRSAAGGAR